MGLARARVLFTLRKIFLRVKAGPRACARTAHGTRGSLARWPPQSLPHQFAGRVSASANPRQRPCFRAYQPAYHPCAYRPRCKVLTGSHVAFRAHQAAHRPLETPAEKYAFAVTAGVTASSKVRFRRQPACQPGSSTSPEKCAFVGNHLGNHALVTIQKMPDSLDTSMDTAPPRVTASENSRARTALDTLP